MHKLRLTFSAASKPSIAKEICSPMYLAPHFDEDINNGTKYTHFIDRGKRKS